MAKEGDGKGRVNSRVQLFEKHSQEGDLVPSQGISSTVAGEGGGLVILHQQDLKMWKTIDCYVFPILPLLYEFSAVIPSFFQYCFEFVCVGGDWG